MPVRDTGLDEDVHRMIKHAADKLNEWVDFAVDLDESRQMARTVRWYVYSKMSPLGWSPEGKPQTATHSFDLMWKMDGGLWSRDINVPPVLNRDGRRVGRVKVRMKRRTGHADDNGS